jgi:hypothetical protein
MRRAREDDEERVARLRQRLEDDAREFQAALDALDRNNDERDARIVEAARWPDRQDARQDAVAAPPPHPDDVETRDDEAHVLTVHRERKRIRTQELAPLVFVYTRREGDYDSDDDEADAYYFFYSQDVVKRRNVLHTIRDMAKKNNWVSEISSDKVEWLLMWVVNDLHPTDALGTGTLVGQDVVVAYMQLNPLPGEWRRRKRADIPHDSLVTYVNE